MTCYFKFAFFLLITAFFNPALAMEESKQKNINEIEGRVFGADKEVWEREGFTKERLSPEGEVWFRNSSIAMKFPEGGKARDENGEVVNIGRNAIIGNGCGVFPSISKYFGYGTRVLEIYQSKSWGKVSGLKDDELLENWRKLGVNVENVISNKGDRGKRITAPVGKFIEIDPGCWATDGITLFLISKKSNVHK